MAAVMAAGVLVLAGAASAIVGGAPTPFAATIAVSPDADPASAAAEAWAGIVPAVTITIRNEGTQTLGSANVTVPDGIVPEPGAPVTASGASATSTAALVGNQIELRDVGLALGGSVTVTVRARVPCAPAEAGYRWAVAAKASRDFTGTSNLVPSTPPLVLHGAGACRLDFTADGQPASAQRSTSITADAFLPAGPRAVSVAVLDGSGAAPVAWWSDPVTLAIDDAHNPGSTTLGGLTSVAPSNGVASFLSGGAGPTIGVSANAFGLTASSPGITGAAPVSGPFDIVDVGKRCVPGQACAGSTANESFAAAVSTVANVKDSVLRFSLGAVDSPAFDCPKYEETTDTLSFDVTTTTGHATGGGKTIAITIAHPLRKASTYELCFRSPTVFRAKNLRPAPRVKDGTFVALLPACSRVRGVAPCLSGRAPTKSGEVVLRALAPRGDPWVKG
jgi:hypothetical protein